MRLVDELTSKMGLLDVTSAFFSLTNKELAYKILSLM